MRQNMVTFLFQVMVCGNSIGWRQESRRVVVYTTDQVNINDSGAYQIINPTEISPHQKKAASHWSWRVPKEFAQDGKHFICPNVNVNLSSLSWTHWQIGT